MLLHNATIWAGRPPRPETGWILVEAGRIAAVGTGEPPTTDDAGLDLEGRHVLAGFCDPHSHLSVGAWLPAVGDAGSWRSRQDCLDAVERAARGSPDPDSWIVFGSAMLDELRGTAPTARELDTAAPGRAVLVVDVSLHHGILSSEGLRRCGFGRSSGPRSAGRDDVTRRRDGEPTGAVWEQAFGRSLNTALRGLAGGFDAAGLDALLDAAATEHLSLGITRVHEPGVPPDVDLRLRALAGRTPLRLSWSASAEAGLLEPPPAAGELPDGPYGEGLRSAKLFLDGATRCALCLPAGAALRSASAAVRTALTTGDTAQLRTLASLRARPRGLHVHFDYLRFDEAELRSRVADLADAGVVLRLHALGNVAVEQAAAVLGGVGPERAVVDHVFVAGARQADRLAASGAHAALQPGFLDTWHAAAESAGGLGAPVRTLLRAGVPVAFSSDHPCGPLDPLHNIRRAVTRRLGGAGGTHRPDEAVTEVEAVDAYTAAAAAALGFGDAGSITAGAVADLAVLSGPPLDPTTRVTETWIGGERAWP